MNDDLERLEALYHDIIAAREEEPSKMWDCPERLGQEILVLRCSTRSQPMKIPNVESELLS